MRIPRILIGLALLAPAAFGQVCDQSFTLRTTACPAGALDCTNKGSTLSQAELDANFVNLVDLCKPFDVALTALTVEGDWTFNGTIAFDQVKSIYFPAGSFSTDVTNCGYPNQITINSGPKTYSVVCGDGGTIYGDVVLLDSLDDTVDITFEITAQDGTGSVTLAGDFSYQCWSNDDAITSSWQTGAATDVTLTTANDLYQGTSAGIDIATPCAAGDWFTWRYVIDDANHTATSANIIGVKLEYGATGGD